MAEIALVASIVQVADVGCRLGIRLYAFGQTVASADQSIISISKDISLTSSVLKELGQIFENDTGKIRSDNATKTAKDTAEECSKIFEQMDDLLLKKAPFLKEGSVDKKARATKMLERLRWPTIKGKIELLNLSLDRMKATLTLMLNVILYAHQISKKTESPSAIAEQKHLIEILAQVKEERDKALEQAKKALSYQEASSTEENAKSSHPIGPGINFMTTATQADMPARLVQTSKSILLQSHASNTNATPSKMSYISRILKEYTRLHESLIREVHSKQYEILDESRLRLERQINSHHELEQRYIEQSKLQTYSTSINHNEEALGQSNLEAEIPITHEMPINSSGPPISNFNAMDRHSETERLTRPESLRFSLNCSDLASKSTERLIEIAEATSQQGVYEFTNHGQPQESRKIDRVGVHHRDGESLSVTTLRDCVAHPREEEGSFQTRSARTSTVIRRKAPPPLYHVVTARALYEFVPGVEGEGESILAFQEGDVLEILEKTEKLQEEGWYRARVQGTKEIGFVPSNYLEIMENISTRGGRPSEQGKRKNNESRCLERLRSTSTGLDVNDYRPAQRNSGYRNQRSMIFNTLPSLAASSHFDGEKTETETFGADYLLKDTMVNSWSGGKDSWASTDISNYDEEDGKGDGKGGDEEGDIVAKLVADWTTVVGEGG